MSVHLAEHLAVYRLLLVKRWPKRNLQPTPRMRRLDPETKSNEKLFENVDSTNHAKHYLRNNIRWMERVLNRGVNKGMLGRQTNGIP